MNLFITGATGFIGKNLLENKDFLKKFNKIYCLTRKKINNKNNIIWVEGNLKSNLNKYFKKSDCLLHLAAHSANKPYDNLNNCFKWNCSISANLINNAYKSGIKKFMILGTYFEYGFAGQIYKEKKISSRSICLPMSTYALSKSFFFQTLFSWSLGKNISIKYLRLPHVFGEGELKSRLWPQIKENKINQIKLDNPKFITNFINIKKLIKKINNYLIIKKFKKNYFEIQNITDKDMNIYNFTIHEKKKLKSDVKILKSKKNSNVFQFLLPKNDNFLIKIK
tara:strand:- start:1090 stop:1929 length:840 start_codon:yes stop_codon:yes gene_type:complete